MMKRIKLYCNWDSLKRYILFPFFQFIAMKFNDAYCGKGKCKFVDDGDRLQIFCERCGYRVNVTIRNYPDKELDEYLNQCSDSFDHFITTEEFKDSIEIS